jgi:hypothetical protein
MPSQANFLLGGATVEEAQTVDARASSAFPKEERRWQGNHHHGLITTGRVLINQVE